MLLRTRWFETTAFFTFAIVASMTLGQVANAQDVGGTVRDAATSEPVRGAVVILLGPNRELLARAITSSSGTFRLARTSATTIRVIRIGYSPHEQRIEASPGPLSISLTPLGTSLRTVTVLARPVCPARTDQREALAIWSSATDGMLAMVVASTDSSQGGKVVQLLYNRLLSDDGRRVVHQSSQRLLTDNASPIRADRDPEEFVEHGYVVRRGNVTTYYGPDPAILLDSSFAATHCLSIRTDARAHPGEVGVAFVPTRERDSIPDITGVLWLTRAPMALKSLTFEYRGVDQAIRDVRAGGRLDFETMSNGVPVIRSWYVRSPKLFYRRAGQMVNRQWVLGDRAFAGELHETGGLIAAGQLVDGTLLATPLATLGGRVLNARTSEVVPGATVTIDSTDQVTAADVRGQFSFEQLLPGPYTVRVNDSVAVYAVKVDSSRNIVPDTTIIQQVVRRVATAKVEARLGHVNPVDLRLPWRDRVGGCGGAESVERRYTVLGVVITPDSIPVPDARARLSWADTSRGTTVETIVEAVADIAGVFFVCGIPGTRLTTRVITTSGRVSDGTATLQNQNVDDESKRRDNLRAIRLVVSRP